MLKNLLQFYLTITIPLLYLLVLATITYTPETFPVALLPYASWLSQSTVRIINMIIAAIGLLLWIISYYHLRHHFGVLPQQKTKPQKVTSGPYRYLKHPMYLAIFLTFTGLALATLSLPGLLINLFILTPVNIIRANREAKSF